MKTKIYIDKLMEFLKMKRESTFRMHRSDIADGYRWAIEDVMNFIEEIIK